MTELLRYVWHVLTTPIRSSPPDSMPTRLTNNDPSEWRSPLGNEFSDTFILPDGRKLGYAEYGSPTGKAILYLHGLPGSRIEGARYHELGLQLGARIIATDRPGYGWSSPHIGRTLLDFPKDLERLGEHLELESYSVMGVSGGGPYALACAAALPPAKLKAVSVVCGVGPPDISFAGAGFPHWPLFRVGWRYAPVSLMRWHFQRDPGSRIDLSDDERIRLLTQPSKLKAIKHAKDLAIYKDEEFLRVWMRASRESFAQGYDGMCQDGYTMCVDWGFRVEDIRADLPVQLWYGKYDRNVPVNHGLQIAARLAGRAHLRVEEDTHASISMMWKREQIEALLAKM
ncbi:Alpha/Beta hydrolase protein [Massariosphaeria phaeospora]|uniref:Alpha/Beta hydrolase protein n=1 Tax=Massariosphaeria phaeospora TaxID=100035 RepID=A0A7C8M461_9PLEO|nr:Alpha/Beta hydrolase protein [Massariosphaeria phaeospora]